MFFVCLKKVTDLITETSQNKHPHVVTIGNILNDEANATWKFL